MEALRETQQQQNGSAVASSSSKTNHYNMSNLDLLLNVVMNYKFIDKVKEECFQQQPEVYELFHQHCHDLYYHVISVRVYVTNILELFKDNKKLLRAFSEFAPKKSDPVLPTQAPQDVQVAEAKDDANVGKKVRKSARRVGIKKTPPINPSEIESQNREPTTKQNKPSTSKQFVPKKSDTVLPTQAPQDVQVAEAKDDANVGKKVRTSAMVGIEITPPINPSEIESQNKEPTTEQNKPSTSTQLVPKKSDTVLSIRTPQNVQVAEAKYNTNVGKKARKRVQRCLEFPPPVNRPEIESQNEEPPTKRNKPSTSTKSNTKVNILKTKKTRRTV